MNGTGMNVVCFACVCFELNEWFSVSRLSFSIMADPDFYCVYYDVFPIVFYYMQCPKKIQDFYINLVIDKSKTLGTLCTCFWVSTT